MNGAEAYAETFNEGLGAAPSNPGACGNLVLDSFSATPNFGMYPLRVTLTTDTACGESPYSITWTFGDGYQATQSSANFTYNNGQGYWTNDFIFNHTYATLGSYVPQAAVSSGAGNVVGTAPVFVTFVPSLFYSFYDVSGLLSQGINGTSTAIGIVDTCVKTNTIIADLHAFDAKFGLSDPTVYLEGPGKSGGSSCTAFGSNIGPEDALDAEWAHVAAPKATLYIYLDSAGSASGLTAGDQWFHTNLNTYHVSIVANTWIVCGLGRAVQGGTGTSLCTGAGDTYSGTTWSSAESAGMNLLASSGDWAPDTCAYSNYPPANPWGLAVGGTTVTRVAATGGYGSESAWYSTTSQMQCYITKTLTSNGYQGETYTSSDSSSYSYYSAPSWQHAFLGNNYRYFPDISVVGDPNTGVPIYYNGGWLIAGGTSVGAPIWAGILDLLFEAGAPGLSGFSASFLYSASSCFHGITNHGGGTDGLGSPDVGCLATA